MNKVAVLFLFFFVLTSTCKAQSKQPKPSKFFIAAGYGLAGSFSVRSYTEVPPFPTVKYREFFKKNFIGAALNTSIGYRLNKKYELQAGMHYQSFNRHAEAADTLVGVVVSVNTNIQDRNYIYFVGLHRNFEATKHILSPGIGLYVIDIRQQSIKYGYGIPNFVSVHESQKGDLSEAGVFADLSYEYKFQPKVNLGFKLQLYYTATASYFESFSLFPFVKIKI